MPRPPDELLSEADLREMAWSEFRESSAWRRSKRGNLWRHWEGLTLSVFYRHGDDMWSWSIASEDGVRYSREAFDSEDDAMEALTEELEID